MFYLRVHKAEEKRQDYRWFLYEFSIAPFWQEVYGVIFKIAKEGFSKKKSREAAINRSLIKKEVYFSIFNAKNKKEYFWTCQDISIENIKKQTRKGLKYCG